MNRRRTSGSYRCASVSNIPSSANVIWALQFDVSGYYREEIAGLNELGLAGNDAATKPSWWQALRLKQKGVFVTPR